MQAIAGLSRSLSRALVQGVVQRSQANEASQIPRPEPADTKLGETWGSFYCSDVGAGAVFSDNSGS